MTRAGLAYSDARKANSRQRVSLELASADHKVDATPLTERHQPIVLRGFLDPHLDNVILADFVRVKPVDVGLRQKRELWICEPHPGEVHLGGHLAVLVRIEVSERREEHRLVVATVDQAVEWNEIEVASA